MGKLNAAALLLALFLVADARCADVGKKAPDADWPSFRGGPEMAGVAAMPLPEKLELLWTHEAGSAVTGTAAVVGDRVFVGTDEGHVLCLALRSGKRLWRVKTGEAVSASPCVVKNVVYVGDEGGVFHALNAADGKELWRFKAEEKILSPATPAPGVILFGSYDFRLYCLDTATGAKKWAFTTENYVHGAPCVVGGQVLIAGCDGFVRMIDLGTGKEAAAVQTDGNFAACPAYGDGDVFVGDMGGCYRRVRRRDAKVVWANQDKDEGGCYAGAAVAADSDRVVFASRGQKVLCLSRKTGAELWTFKAKSGFDSSPVIAGGSVLVGCDDGNLYRLRLNDGAEEWRFRAGAPISASPAVARGRLVIGAEDGAVLCFGAKPGTPK